MNRHFAESCSSSDSFFLSYFVDNKWLRRKKETIKSRKKTNTNKLCSRLISGVELLIRISDAYIPDDVLLYSPSIIVSQTTDHRRKLYIIYKK